jgi:putative dimethyl sulfoxide reductase chaperone
MSENASTTPIDAVGPTLQLIAATYRSPGPALQEDLVTGAFAAALDALADAAGTTAPEFGDVDWNELRAAYVALFVTCPGGIAAPPYVGYAADGELLGSTTDALLAFYRGQGLQVNADWADLPDHVAAVAEAGALLADADRDEAARTLAAAFLSPWFERYASAVVAADTSGFYGPLTEFFRSVMSEVACEVAS